MSDSTVGPKCYGTAELADRVVESYARQPAFNYFMSAEGYCVDAGASIEKCGDINAFIHRGPCNVNMVECNGPAPDVYGRLEQRNFCREFINHLGGYDGKRALRERVKWSGERCANILWWNTCSVQERQSLIDNMKRLAKFVPEAIEILEKYAYNDRDKMTRVFAIYAVGGVGTNEAKSSLTRMLDTGDETMRVVAVSNLPRYFTGEKALPVLVKALSDKNSIVRSSAVDVMRLNRADHKKYIPFIVGLIKGGEYVEEYIYTRLKYKNIDEFVVYSLINELYSDNARTRHNMAVALGVIGADAFMALPILNDMVTDDPYSKCREAAAWAYKKIVEETW